MSSPSSYRLSKSGSTGAAMVQLVNKGETSPVLLINPVFTITANNWEAACAAAATRRCYPKVRQKSKSSGASPQRYPSQANLGFGDEFINIITSTESVNVELGESVYEDFADYGSHSSYSHSRPNSNSNSNPYLHNMGNRYYGSNTKLLQVPSSSALYYGDDNEDGAQGYVKPRSSSITVPIQHVGRSPERCNSEVFIRRCSSASPKGRYNQYMYQYKRQEDEVETERKVVRLTSSSHTSPNKPRGRGFSLTISQTQQLLPEGVGGSCSGIKRRASYTARKRRLSYQQQQQQKNEMSSSSSSISSHSPFHSPRRQSMRNPSQPQEGENGKPALPRQRTLSMPTNVQQVQFNDPLGMEGKTIISSISTAKEKEDEPVSKESSESSEEDGSFYDVVIIGSPNVGKSTLAEYFNKGGSSGSDQGIGSGSSGDEDSCDDQDLRGGGKTIVYRPQVEVNQLHPYNFSLRIFCQQTSAVTHLYKYDAVIIIYSVTDRDSFEFARRALGEILPLHQRPSAGRRNSTLSTTSSNASAPGPSSNSTCGRKVVILVGNKSDLERSRCVSSLEGRSLATAYDVKFIEISSSLAVGIAELQKGLAKQIQLRHVNSASSNSQQQEGRNENSIVSQFGKIKLSRNKCGSTSSSSSNSSTNYLITPKIKDNSSGSGGGGGGGSKGFVSHSTFGAFGKKGTFSSLKLAQKLIDRIMALKIVGNGKTKSCLDLHSL